LKDSVRTKNISGALSKGMRHGIVLGVHPIMPEYWQHSGSCVEKCHHECPDMDRYTDNIMEHFMTDLESSNMDDKERDREESDST
jgi:hypothetical protein